MPGLSPVDPALVAQLEAVAAQQDGLIARRQVFALGFRPEYPRQRLRLRQWRTVYPGVYATFTGPLPPRARVWAAVLACGDDAAAAGRTALWLAGVTALGSHPSTGTGRGPIEVVVPRGRHIVAPAGVVVRRRRLAPRAVLGGSPPRLRVESAVCDLAEAATCDEEVIDLVTLVVQQRHTTAARLRDELATRARHRRRSVLTDVLAEVADGVRSPLELRYRRIERAHGLPPGEYNPGEVDLRGRSRYPDVRYLGGRVAAELDGQGAHPVAGAHRDRHRDNVSTLEGRRTLRFGWREVVGEPCGVAADVVAALRLAGWDDGPTPCAPTCPLRLATTRGSA